MLRELLILISSSSCEYSSNSFDMANFTVRLVFANLVMQSNIESVDFGGFEFSSGNFSFEQNIELQ